MGSEREISSQARQVLLTQMLFPSFSLFSNWKNNASSLLTLNYPLQSSLCVVAYRVGDIEENAFTDRILISLRSPAPIRHLNHQKVHKLFSLTYWCFQVRQLLAVDGRVHLNFGITATGSSQNYTRSYYLNGRDYIVSGSCDEHVVRICCAQTGRRLRDISLEVQYSSDLHIICPPLMCDVWIYSLLRFQIWCLWYQDTKFLSLQRVAFILANSTVWWKFSLSPKRQIFLYFNHE